MQGRSDRHDIDAARLHAVVETAIRLQETASSAVNALRTSTEGFKRDAAASIRTLDAVGQELPKQVASRVNGQLEDAANTAAERMSDRLESASQRAQAAAAAMDASARGLTQRVLTIFVAGLVTGVLVAYATAVALVYFRG